MIRTFTPAQQVKGAFDYGRIQENKPIGFPHESHGAKSFSTLFYWAHAWSEPGGLIDLHPHKGFEIMSYVLEGEIEHYDTLLKKWLKIKKGGLQIIRSGNGISHAERILPGGQMFQIWMDPNLAATLAQPAEYDDYEEEVFPVREENGLTIRTLAGEGSPLRKNAPGDMERVYFEAGTFSLPLKEGQVMAAFVIDGEVSLEGETLEKGTYIQASKVGAVNFEASAAGSLFVVRVPEKAPYRTYAGN